MEAGGGSRSPQARKADRGLRVPVAGRRDLLVYPQRPDAAGPARPRLRPARRSANARSSAGVDLRRERPDARQHQGPRVMGRPGPRRARRSGSGSKCFPEGSPDRDREFRRPDGRPGGPRGREQPRKVYTTYMVQLDAGPVGKLRPGMVARVDIPIFELDDVLSVPVGAVASSPRRLDRVQVRAPDGSTEWRTVTLGRSNGEAVEVKEGLRPGDRVLLKLHRRPGRAGRAARSPASDGDPATGMLSPRGPSGRRRRSRRRRCRRRRRGRGGPPGSGRCR